MPSPIEVAAPDTGVAARFLREVFDWEIGAGAGAIAGNIDTGAGQVEPNDIRVAGSLLRLPEGMNAYTAVFVRVADLDGTLVKAVEHGAKVVLPRTDTPNGPTVAVIAAPQGLMFGLVQL